MNKKEILDSVTRVLDAQRQLVINTMPAGSACAQGELELACMYLKAAQLHIDFVVREMTVKDGEEG